MTTYICENVAITFEGGKIIDVCEKIYAPILDADTIEDVNDTSRDITTLIPAIVPLIVQFAPIIINLFKGVDKKYEKKVIAIKHVMSSENTNDNKCLLVNQILEF